MSVHVETDSPYPLTARRRRPQLAARPWFTLAGIDEGPKARLLEPIDAPEPERGTKVAVAPIARAVRDQVRREGITWSIIALRLGWTYGPGGGPDTTRLLRRLGLALATQNNGRPALQQRWIGRELAARIIRAADLDPVDVDL